MELFSPSRFQFRFLDSVGGIQMSRQTVGLGTNKASFDRPMAMLLQVEDVFCKTLFEYVIWEGQKSSVAVRLRDSITRDWEYERGD